MAPKARKTALERSREMAAKSASLERRVKRERVTEILKQAPHFIDGVLVFLKEKGAHGIDLAELGVHVVPPEPSADGPPQKPQDQAVEQGLALADVGQGAALLALVDHSEAVPRTSPILRRLRRRLRSTSCRATRWNTCAAS